LIVVGIAVLGLFVYWFKYHKNDNNVPKADSAGDENHLKSRDGEEREI
jgi:hypothetical protein